MTFARCKHGALLVEPCDDCGTVPMRPTAPPADIEGSQEFTITHDDVVQAITHIEDARQSHVLWAAHLRNSNHRDCQGCSDHAAHIGDADYHDRWIKKYDHVIRLLAHAPYTRSSDASKEPLAIAVAALQRISKTAFAAEDHYGNDTGIAAQRQYRKIASDALALISQEGTKK